MRICIYVNLLKFFLYSEIEMKKSFKNDQGVTRFLMPSFTYIRKINCATL